MSLTGSTNVEMGDVNDAPPASSNNVNTVNNVNNTNNVNNVNNKKNLKPNVKCALSDMPQGSNKNKAEKKSTKKPQEDTKASSKQPQDDDTKTSSKHLQDDDTKSKEAGTVLKNSLAGKKSHSSNEKSKSTKEPSKDSKEPSKDSKEPSKSSNLTSDEESKAGAENETREELAATTIPTPTPNPTPKKSFKNESGESGELPERSTMRSFYQLIVKRKQRSYTLN
jgi:hypothetical protein